MNSISKFHHYSSLLIFWSPCTHRFNIGLGRLVSAYSDEDIPSDITQARLTTLNFMGFFAALCFYTL
jgi:hypothetical protein